MTNRKNVKESRELPSWIHEEAAHAEQQEAQKVPVAEPQTPWYLQEKEQVRHAEVELPSLEGDASLDVRYFRVLINLLNDTDWSHDSIESSVATWLGRPDHFRFVVAQRTLPREWSETLCALKVPAVKAETICQKIQQQLHR